MANKTFDEIFDNFALQVQTEPGSVYEINRKLAKLEIGLSVMTMFSKALEGESFTEVSENFRKMLREQTEVQDEPSK